MLSLAFIFFFSTFRLIPAPAAEVRHSAPMQFTNVTKQAGISFVHYNGKNGIATTLEVMGPGVCVADFDGDGFQDIYFVNGRDLYNRGITSNNAL